MARPAATEVLTALIVAVSGRSGIRQPAILGVSRLQAPPFVKQRTPFATQSTRRGNAMQVTDAADRAERLGAQTGSTAAKSNIRKPMIRTFHHVMCARRRSTRKQGEGSRFRVLQHACSSVLVAAAQASSSSALRRSAASPYRCTCSDQSADQGANQGTRVTIKVPTIKADQSVGVHLTR